jgi:3-oxoacyl-[acyl-carrier-protein] synthase II
MGAITPVGHSVKELFQGMVEGKSGVAPITHFNARRLPTTFAAEVKNFDFRTSVADPASWKYAGSNSRFAVGASRQALEDANLFQNSKVDRTRIGVYFGTGEGMQDFPHLVTSLAQSYNDATRRLDIAEFMRGGLKYFLGEGEIEQEMHTTTARIATEFDLEGPNFNILTACAAGSQAIGEATEMIRHGDADIMVSGGSHSMIHPLGVTGFNLLTALSQHNQDPRKASRPFDLHRDGFVLGEGSGVVVLEELEHAKKRGATIYGELTGYGSTADAFRITDTHEDGRGAIACLQMALRDSGLAPGDIGYINAHGTSTKVNDSVETLAIKKVFGDGARAIPVSSSKSMIGHLIAAAGAVELIISLMAIRSGVLPPTINYETPDPECDLDYIPNTAREKKIRHAVSNSFGFGGQNVSLIVSQFDG